MSFLSWIEFDRRLVLEWGVEVEVVSRGPLVGKTISEAGLRDLS